MPSVSSIPYRPRNRISKEAEVCRLQSQRKCNRLKVGYNFLATLPEAMCNDSDSEQLKEVTKGQAPSVGPEGLELHQTDDPSHTSSIAPVAVKP